MKVNADLSRVSPDIARNGIKEMLSIDVTGPKPHVRVNSSSLSVMQACWRKSHYMLERKLRAKNESPATLFGSAIHKALEVFYNEPREKRKLPARMKELLPTIAYGETPPDDNFIFRAIKAFVEVAKPLSVLPDSDKRSLAAGVWLLQHYFETYINDPFEVMHDENGPIVERTFSLPVVDDAEIMITLFGTIDVVLRNVQTGVILPTDHKTSSVVGNDFYNRLRPNHQYTAYMLGAQRVLGLDTESFMVNCLQVKPKPVTARGTPPHFPRQVTKRDPADIEEFLETLTSYCKTFVRNSMDRVWPMGGVESCTSYGGCQFLDVCSAPLQLRETIIESKFN